MSAGVMRNVSHTLIGAVRAAVNAWRRRECWSRETVVAHIIDQHQLMLADVDTGIRFITDSADTFERMKVNADRVFRWLDDETKDNNLLPANFLRSIIMALPIDLSLAVAQDLLADSGLRVNVSSDQVGDFSPSQHLRALIKECAEATSAVAELADGGGRHDMQLMQRADRELAEAAAAVERARASIRQRLGAGK